MPPNTDRFTLPPAFVWPTYPFLRATVIEQVTLPFRIVVLSDLQGQERANMPRLRDRKLKRVRANTFEQLLRSMKPEIKLRAPIFFDPGIKISVELKIEKLEDFAVEGPATQVPFVRALLGLRDSLAYLSGKMTPALEEWLRRWLAGWGASRDQLQRDLLAVAEADPSFSGKDEARLAADAIRECISHGWEDLYSPGDLLEGDLPALVEQLDDLLRQQLRWILHAPAFASLRAAWYGLACLVREAEASGKAGVSVFSASKEELDHDLADPAKSVLHRRLVEEELRSFGGQPASVLLADYAFARTREDLDLLERLGDLATAANSVLLAGVDPGFFHSESFCEPESAEEFEGRLGSPLFESWRRFRATPGAARVAVAIPRMQIQMPPSAQPPGGFRYESPASGYGPEAAMAAVSGAYAVAGGIIQAACPGHSPAREGGLTARYESVLLTDERRRMLAEHGFLTWRSGREGRFEIAQPGHCCCAETAHPADGLALESAAPAGTLDAVLVGCRVAQYFHAIIRDRRESFEKTPEFRQWLEEWVANLFAQARQDATGRDLPFDSAEITLEEPALPFGQFRVWVTLRDRARKRRFAFSVDSYSSKRAAERAAEKAAEEPSKTLWV